MTLKDQPVRRKRYQLGFLLPTSQLIRWNEIQFRSAVILDRREMVVMK
jgi:hypothetical protein